MIAFKIMSCCKLELLRDECGLNNTAEQTQSRQKENTSLNEKVVFLIPRMHKYCFILFNIRKLSIILP